MRAVKEIAAAFPEKEPGTAKLRGWPARVRQFAHEVRLELRNVNWPTRNDVQATTVVVLVATFFFGFYLGMALDVPMSWFMNWLLKAAPGWIR